MNTFQHSTPVLLSHPASVSRPKAVDSAWIRDAIQEIRADAHRWLAVVSHCRPSCVHDCLQMPSPCGPFNGSQSCMAKWPPVLIHACRSADTHLFRVNLPAFSRHGVDFYLKDESSHPTGSLKHRLARSLFLYGLCNNLIHPDMPVYEASSGSTAVSEAYFARMLGLSFTAVMSKTVSAEKIAAIEFYGGKCHLVETAGLASRCELRRFCFRAWLVVAGMLFLTSSGKGYNCDHDGPVAWNLLSC